MGKKREKQVEKRVSNCIDGEICVLIFSVWVDHLAVSDVLIPFSKLHEGNRSRIGDGSRLKVSGCLALI